MSRKRAKSNTGPAKRPISSLQASNIGGVALMRRHAVQIRTGLPTSTLYDLIGKGEFPKPIALTPGRVAWVAAEVEIWIAQRISAARGVSAAA